MAEAVLQLQINRTQLERFFAHIFTYLYCLTLQAFAQSSQPTLEMIKELGSRFFALCALEETEFALTLSAEEVGVLKDLFPVLQQHYLQSSPSEQRALALSHLSECRHLVEQATNQKEEYLSVRETARLMAVSTRTVYGYLEAGKLQGTRQGITTVITAQAVRRYQRSVIGRPRTRTPIWRKPVLANLEYLTTITVRMRSEQGEKLAQRLAEIRVSASI